MRSTVLLIALLLIAPVVLAQENATPGMNIRVPSGDPDDQPAPDFSRDNLMRLFATGEEPPESPESRIQHELGAIAFRAGGMRWRIGYLPFLAPLPGSYLTTNREWPDPFLLTGTQYASPRRTWRDQRAMSAELKRIERRLRDTDRSRATVTVTPD